MNKLVFLGLSIPDISRTAICEYWCDYSKSKYPDSSKLWYTDTDCFVVHVKLEDVYGNLVGDVEQCLTHQITKSKDLYP